MRVGAYGGGEVAGGGDRGDGGVEFAGGGDFGVVGCWWGWDRSGMEREG